MSAAHWRLFGDGVAAARRVRAEVAERVRLACSVGVAANKFIAKMASVDAKPRARPDGVDPGPGVFEVAPGDEVAYLHPLPVRRLWGVGPSTYERLHRLGIATIGDLAAASPQVLRGVLGPAAATRLNELANGIDDRPVETERPMKSVSHEETFAFDLHDSDDLRAELVRLADGVATRLRANGLAARTISLKVRDATFTTFTRASTLSGPVDTAATIATVVVGLLDKVQPVGGVRLLGVTASKFVELTEQLQLDGVGDDATSWRAATAAIDRVRGRFGGAAIGPTSSLSPHGLRVVRRGQHQWGTDEPAPSEKPGSPH